MISIVKIGAKQYRASLGARFRVEKLSAEKGSTWTGGKVLCLINEQGDSAVGDPFVEKARIKAQVVRHGKEKKVLILKKKRRKGYRRTKGHRQMFTEIFVTALADADGKWFEQPKKPLSKKPLSKKPAKAETKQT